MDEHQGTFGVEPILRTIGEKTSTYYDRRARRASPSAHALRDGELLEPIRAIHAESGGIYGSPRIHAMLRREGEAVSRKRVERLMREHEIIGVCPARKVRTTIPNPTDARPEDLVKRNFTADGPNRLWVTDLTLIETGEGPLWLSSIRDAFSRRIVAWHTAPRPDAELVCTALEYALASRDYERGELIHHADHGSQYTSIKLTSRLLKAGIKAGTGTIGDSYDKRLSSYCSPSVFSRGFGFEVGRAPGGVGHALPGGGRVGAGWVEEVAVLLVVGHAFDQAVAAPDLDGLLAGADRGGVLGEAEQALLA